MICPKCHNENPELNRFCGMCGSRLPEARADQARPAAPENETKTAPENGTKTPSVRRPFIVSTTAMADITAQMLNTRVVLPSPSVATATHFGYVTPLRPRVDEIAHGEDLPVREPAPVDPADEPMFAQRPATVEPGNGFVHELNLDTPVEQQALEHHVEEQESEARLDRTVAEHEAHLPPPPPSRGARSGSIFGLDAPSPADPPFTEERFEAPVHNQFIQFDEPTVERSRDVSGPSFLGLGTQDYLMEEQEPVSHTRRNVLLLVLVIILVLGFLEWRASNRGGSMNPMEVLHLKLPKKKGQGQVEVLPSAANVPASDVPASNGADSSSSTTSNTAVSNTGKPDLIAEPNQPATQSGNQGPQNPATSSSAPAANSSNAYLSTTPAASTNAPPSAAANSKPQSIAPDTTKSASNSSGPTPVAAKAAPAKPSATPKAAQTEIAKASPPARPTKPSSIPQSDTAASSPATSDIDASLSAGAFELQKGKAAGATEDGRMWLWKAVAKGNGEAPVLLADMYLQGNGVAKDCEQAVLLLNAAAKKANPRARTKLGSMYASGQCVPQDRVQAYKWMTSALQANPGSEWIERNRQSLLSEMTPGERQRAAAIR